MVQVWFLNTELSYLRLLHDWTFAPKFMFNYYRAGEGTYLNLLSV
jgi:hypothetical protein